MKKIIFLTGTRADFGKVKSLIGRLEDHPDFEVFVFVTGMHLQYEYGFTLLEIERCNYSNVETFSNYTHETTMDLTLARTIEGLSAFMKKVNPDLIVVHGDRVETLAGAIVGSLNNILVAHIEGGELSGTVDELLRHSVSKLSHIHYVANEEAKKRLIQMGEIEQSIYVIGSPDVDLMFSEKLPKIEEVKEYYKIFFSEYAVGMFHPVTTEFREMKTYAENFVNAVLESDQNYVIIYPNNDLGSSVILNEYKRFREQDKVRLIPSLRFEYFLTLLKNAKFIIGNSSAGIREAPYYGIPVINIGSRQSNRTSNVSIINSGYTLSEIKKALVVIQEVNPVEAVTSFGKGNSTEKFMLTLSDEQLWNQNHQKQFRDL